MSFGDYGNLVGSSPVWAGFYARFDRRRRGYHIEHDAPRTPYGWRIKVLWVLDASVDGPARAVATSTNGRSRLWFRVAEGARRPRADATLDPAHPGVPPTGDYLEFPSYVFIPRAGCYRFQLRWPGDSWTLVIGLGR